MRSALAVCLAVVMLGGCGYSSETIYEEVKMADGTVRNRATIKDECAGCEGEFHWTGQDVDLGLKHYRQWLELHRRCLGGSEKDRS